MSKMNVLVSLLRWCKHAWTTWFPFRFRTSEIRFCLRAATTTSCSDCCILLLARIAISRCTALVPWLSKQMSAREGASNFTILLLCTDTSLSPAQRLFGPPEHWRANLHQLLTQIISEWIRHKLNEMIFNFLEDQIGNFSAVV